VFRGLQSTGDSDVKIHVDYTITIPEETENADDILNQVQEKLSASGAESESTTSTSWGASENTPSFESVFASILNSELELQAASTGANYGTVESSSVQSEYIEVVEEDEAEGDDVETEAGAESESDAVDEDAESDSEFEDDEENFEGEDDEEHEDEEHEDEEEEAWEDQITGFFSWMWSMITNVFSG